MPRTHVWARRSFVALLAALLLGGGDASASSARFTLPELIEHSDVIARGTLVGFERVPDPYDAGTIRAGIIRIDLLLKGPVELDRFRLILPQPGEPAAGASTDFRQGDTGLWFLRRVDASGQLYAADHPQRFVSTTSADQISDRVEAELNR